MSSPEPFDPAAWEGVAAANLSDAMGRAGAMDGGIRRLSGDRVAGPAHTVMTSAGDSSTIHRALTSADPGSVLVVDAEGGTSRAVWGAVLTAAAIERGVAGVVIDGAVRDIGEIRSLGFPVYSRATCPAGPHKGFRGQHGVTVQCGGVVVSQGDVIVGDADGVAVVRATEARAALAFVREVVLREQRWLVRIRAGETTTEILDLD